MEHQVERQRGLAVKYYLRHYFDPDFNHLKPKTTHRDNVSDMYSMGYVQNVINGQVLAEIVPFEQAGENHDPRFVLNDPVFPSGANTRVDPAHPQYLLAAANGYVFYIGGRITVKCLLNVRQDVCFQTGNIFFVGDMAIHGSVRSGFSIQGNNVRIMGMLEGGEARARKDIMIEGGARGGAGQRCLVTAGGKILTPFLEKVEARSRDNIMVEKFCLYSTIYAGANLIVRDQLYGSTINAYGTVYVGKQLGNKAGLTTKIFLGYDPLSIRHLEKIDDMISSMSQSMTHLTAVAGHLPPNSNEASRKLAKLTEERQQLMHTRDNLWNRLYADEKLSSACRLSVPGIVYPGVEIYIGRAFMMVERVYQNVSFRLCYDDIMVEPLPVPKKAV
ncbi:MAG: FapA family protein [Desulfovibrio sp.]|jgi:uncharacterized protein (DUF342 family)|nr:FapA family protein [Desulfovibrio sp.]